MSEGCGPPRSNWIVAICSVLFDLDVGQRIDSIFPEDVLTEEESNDVAFHSFPDSMSLELHSRSSVKDSTFFFRIKRRSTELPPDGKPPLSLHHAASDGSFTKSHYTECKSPFLYGFVFCRQRQDERLRRGGEQKSVVVLSMYPYSCVLGPLSQWAGPAYFNHGHESLQEAFTFVSEWEEPEAGGRAIVSIGELSIMTNLPAADALPPPAPAETLAYDAQLQQPHMSHIALAHDDMQKSPTSLPGVFHEVDMYTPLKAILPKAWVLWELMLLAEPLMVVAPSPGESSSTVAALVSLISPMPYAADFRPFFTIHDADFAALAAGQLPNGHNALPRLLGVTNLYFLKALPAWPNVMSTGTRQSTLQRQGSGSSLGSSGNLMRQGSGGSGSGGGSRLGAAMRAARRRAAGPQCLLTEHVENLWLASYRPLTRPAYGVLRRLASISDGDPPDKAARAAAANSAVLRAHFAELTTAFLEPFRSYLQVEPLPEGDGPLPAGGPPHAPPFSHAAFLDNLQATKGSAALLERFGSHSGCLAFYRRFLEGPNFPSWFERRRQAIMLAQEAAWSEAATQRGIQGSEPPNPHQGEVDLVGTFFGLEQRLITTGGIGPTGPRHSQAVKATTELESELVRVFEAMPRDLQQLVLSSPQRANLLHRLQAHSKIPIPGGAIRPQSHRKSLDAAFPGGNRPARHSLNGQRAPSGT